MEETIDGSIILLIFDPGCRQMKKFQTSTDIESLMPLVWQDVGSLTARQYQILSVQGLIFDQEERKASGNSYYVANFVSFKLVKTYMLTIYFVPDICIVIV